MVCSVLPQSSFTGSLRLVLFAQSDTMDVLDEKASGIPPMEIEEVVSVHDREHRSAQRSSIAY